MQNIHETPGWKNAEEIIIMSKNHLNRLLSQGFEIQDLNFMWKPDKTEILLYLTAKKKRIIADAIRIFEYVIHLQPLYDFNRRKISFTWVPDTSIYWNFEVKLTRMLTGEYNKPICRRKIESTYRDVIFNRMYDWVTSGKTSLI